jgi:hypothetical protein
MELSVLNDGRILFIERHGAVRLYNTSGYTGSRLNWEYNQALGF